MGNCRNCWQLHCCRAMLGSCKGLAQPLLSSLFSLLSSLFSLLSSLSSSKYCFSFFPLYLSFPLPPHPLVSALCFLRFRLTTQLKRLQTNVTKAAGKDPVLLLHELEESHAKARKLELSNDGLKRKLQLERVKGGAGVRDPPTLAYASHAHSYICSVLACLLPGWCLFVRADTSL